VGRNGMLAFWRCYATLIQYKLEHPPAGMVVPSSQQTPYKPVALGGVWEGVTITDGDIAEVRHEMWDNFGEREL